MNGQMDSDMMADSMMAPMMLYMGLWGMVALALIALSIAATVWLVRSQRAPRMLPLHRLDERYAAGELSREEYLQRRGDLTASSEGQ